MPFPSGVRLRPALAKLVVLLERSRLCPSRCPLLSWRWRFPFPGVPPVLLFLLRCVSFPFLCEEPGEETTEGGRERKLCGRRGTPPGWTRFLVGVRGERPFLGERPPRALVAAFARRPARRVVLSGRGRPSLLRGNKNPQCSLFFGGFERPGSRGGICRRSPSVRGCSEIPWEREKTPLYRYRRSPHAHPACGSSLVRARRIGLPGPVGLGPSRPQ